MLFLVLRWMTHRICALKSPGLVAGTFMVGYGVARSFSEFFRQPDLLHSLTVGFLTPGIAYSIPMILLGIYFIRSARMRRIVSSE